MNAPIARLKSEEPLQAPERRREPRYTATGHDAIIRSSKGNTESAQPADLSLHGCSVRSSADWLRNGSFVTIGLDDESMLQAIVRWVRDGSAGMEFLRPIPPERVEWHSLLDSPFGP